MAEIMKNQLVTRNSESGFSLLEVSIAAMLTVGIMGMVFALMNRNQQVFFTETNVTDMNQNMRTSFDLLTRDVQSAGMGLPRINGSFAAIFYTNGANGAPDTIMMVNGDPYAPTAKVDDRAAGSAEFFCDVPDAADLTITGNGQNQTMTYVGENGQMKPIYQDYSKAPIMYICYDDTRAMIFALTQDGMTTGSASNQKLRLQHNPSSVMNPPSVFGTLLDSGEPDYNNSSVAVLNGTIAYRLNQATRELERTENLINWYSVARGIINFQVRYRVVNATASGVIEVDAPTVRKDIRAVIFTITAETPDIDPISKNYRQSVQKFEVAPRNFNLLNNTNLSTNQE
jgi:hypothetical protein